MARTEYYDDPTAPKSVAAGRLEKLPGLGRGEGSEASGARRRGLDVPGDVARQFVLAHDMLQGGLEYVSLGLVRARASKYEAPPGLFWRGFCTS
ncbi:hypothetical protein HW130_02445 [Streptomyces sp. PKU-EA00015]|nr:hypothetical protein [Streptomyces sp. PKU-EA00015]